MISQERIIICGTNGTGKSTFTNNLIDSSLKNFPNKKALAVLPDDSEPIFYPYTEIQRNLIRNVNNLSSQKNKIYFDKSSLWDDIRLYFRDGILALDDARFYTGSNDEQLKRLFIRSRQNNIHIVFICHGLSEIPPNLFTFCTKLVLFNTLDSWQRLKQKIPNPDKFETLVNTVRTIANNHKQDCPAKYNSSEKCSYQNCRAGYTHKIIDLKKLFANLY